MGGSLDERTSGLWRSQEKGSRDGRLDPRPQVFNAFDARAGAYGMKVKVSLFYQGYFLPTSISALLILNCELQISGGTAGPQRQAPELSGHCQTSTESSRLQWALPDLNRTLDVSGHCRASTASDRAQLRACKMQHRMSDKVAVGTAGLHVPAPGRSGHCRTSCASSRSQWALPGFICQQQIAVGTAGLHVPAPDRVGTAGLHLPATDRSWHCRNSAAGFISQRALPDFICQQQIAVGTAGLHLPAPDRSGHCRTSGRMSE
eukprot:s3761_g4.t1